MAGLLTVHEPAPGARSIASDAVSRELRLWAQTAFAWGRSDCLLSIVRYAARVAARPMPEWPRYSTGAGALRILERHGGLAAYAAGVLEGLGCTPTGWPDRGDVGLIDIPGTGPTMCLCLGAKWAARAMHGGGVVIVPLHPEIAWSVPRAGERRRSTGDKRRRPCLAR
jgi:hypothetical protein